MTYTKFKYYKKYYFLLFCFFATIANAQETLDITISKNGSNQLVYVLNQDASFRFNQTFPVANNSAPNLVIKDVFAADAANIQSDVGSRTGFNYISNTSNTGNPNSMGSYGFAFGSGSGAVGFRDAILVFPEHSIAFQNNDFITIKAGTIISTRTYNNSNANNTIPAVNPGPYTAFIPNNAYSAIAAPQVPLVTLPVKLTSFIGFTKNSSVVLNWETSSELNSKGFEIEHSNNKTGWQNIGFVNSNGTKDGVSKYAFTHLSPADGQNYYRLKSVDNDGRFEYSLPIPIKTITEINVVVTPNPSSNILKIDGINHGTVTIVDMIGKVVKTHNLSEGDINISDLNPGYFIINIVSKDSLVYTQKILKN